MWDHKFVQTLPTDSSRGNGSLELAIDGEQPENKCDDSTDDTSSSREPLVHNTSAICGRELCCSALGDPPELALVALQATICLGSLARLATHVTLLLLIEVCDLLR